MKWWQTVALILAALSLTACASPRSEAGQEQDSEFIKTHVHPVQITDLDGNTVNCIVYDDYTGSSGGSISCEWPAEGAGF